MYNTEDMIKTIRKNDKTNDYLWISTIDILKKLSNYELKEIIRTDENGAKYNALADCYSANDVLRLLVKIGAINSLVATGGDNSGNWNAPTTQDINWNFIQAADNKGIYVRLSVYTRMQKALTSEIILYFESEEQFYSELSKCDKIIKHYINGEEYQIHTNFFATDNEHLIKNLYTEQVFYVIGEKFNDITFEIANH